MFISSTAPKDVLRRSSPRPQSDAWYVLYSFDFDGTSFPVYDPEGKPWPPQVCVDFVLDTFELGIVHAVNPLQDMLSRPLLRIVSDPQGNILHPGNLVDLADRSPQGEFLRTIIKTEDPDRYGIRVADYFL